MRLGIVGHADEKFTDATRALARTAIRASCLNLCASLVVSGHSPMGGVGIFAEEIAAELEIPTLIHAPMVNTWGGQGGFRDRNEAIARDSDMVLCVVVEKLPPQYQGMKFNGCYHCKDRTPTHVKSGGCWTAWRAPKQMWAIVSDASFHLWLAEPRAASVRADR